MNRPRNVSSLMHAKAEAWEYLLTFLELLGMLMILCSFGLLAVGLAPVVGLN